MPGHDPVETTPEFQQAAAVWRNRCRYRHPLDLGGHLVLHIGRGRHRLFGRRGWPAVELPVLAHRQDSGRAPRRRTLGAAPRRPDCLVQPGRLRAGFGHVQAHAIFAGHQLTRRETASATAEYIAQENVAPLTDYQRPSVSRSDPDIELRGSFPQSTYSRCSIVSMNSSARLFAFNPVFPR
jgi:hypothetical protein